MTVYGIDKRLVSNVVKPRFLSDSVMYCCGGVNGIWNVRPMMYSGLGKRSVVSRNGSSIFGQVSSVPKIVVTETLPQCLWSDGLAVVHAALARVFAENSIDDDLLFPKLRLCQLPSTRQTSMSRGQTVHQTSRVCRGTNLPFGRGQEA
jgi:hypothetical protein